MAREFMGEWMGVGELARFLGLARITIYRLTERGDIPARKVGAKWRYMKAEVDQWLKEERMRGRR